LASARTTQRLLLGLTVGLLLAVGLTHYFVRNAPAPAPPAAAPAAAPAAPVAREPQAPVAETVPPAQPSPPDPADIPLSELPLRLLATVVADNPAASLATVADVEHHTSAVMREGQRFEGRATVRLTAIERERVLIDNDGVREQLVLLHFDAAPERPEAGDISFEEREYRRDLARRLRALTDAGEDALGPGERGGLLAEGDVSAAYQDGEMIGVQIDSVRPGGLYDRIGLRSGDVVTGIGGVSLADPDVMVQVIEKALTQDKLVLTVEKPGGGTTEIPLDPRELEALSPAPETPE
jgi:general secretion pathway protein C